MTPHPLTPTPAQVRAAIAAQRCPYCGATRNSKGHPLRLLANHTEHVHGIDRLALRLAAGLDPDATGLCAPELSAGHRERNTAPENAAARRGDGSCARCRREPRISSTNGYCVSCRREYNREWMRRSRGAA